MSKVRARAYRRSCPASAAFFETARPSRITEQLNAVSARATPLDETLVRALTITKRRSKCVGATWCFFGASFAKFSTTFDSTAAKTLVYHRDVLSVGPPLIVAPNRQAR